MLPAGFHEVYNTKERKRRNSWKSIEKPLNLYVDKSDGSLLEYSSNTNMNVLAVSNQVKDH
jgi:hypothetical protein